MDEAVDQAVDLEKESKPKQYSPEYYEALLEQVKQYVPKNVMDNLHHRALPRAGGKASANARQARSTQETQAAATQAEVSAEVEKQPIPADITPIPLPVNPSLDKPLTPPTPPQLQSTPCAEGDEACEEQTTGQTSGPPTNQGNQITGKSKMDKEEMEKTAHGKQDAPIADTNAWDGAAAEKRLLAWAGGPDKDNVNWQKFGKGFLYHDPKNADNIGGYKYPVADIINGQFKISAAALSAAAGRINQSSGIPSDELNSMKATLRSYYKDIGEDAPDNIAKQELHPDCQKVANNCMKMKAQKSADIDVATYTGKRPIVTFVAASPGVTEALRKAPLVGSPGKLFNDNYLTPLGLTRNDISVMYLVPQLLKDEKGHVREPNAEEIEKWQPWFESELGVLEKDGKKLLVALGHTVKKALERDVDFTMPHPNAMGTARTEQELQRKRLQVSKALEARYRKN